MAKRFYSGDYAGYEGRKSQEREDGSMLREDRGAVANLPQDVKYHSWPSANNYQVYNVGDTIKTIDSQISEDSNGTKRHRSKNKY